VITPGVGYREKLGVSSFIPLVIMPGVGSREGFEDSTDRLPDLGPEQKMKMIGHETRAKETKRIALLGLGEGLEKGDVVGVAKDVSAVVAAIKGVIDEPVIGVAT
jgi:hypothetical protein